MIEVRTTWGFTGAALSTKWYEGSVAESEKARQFELHARRVAEAGPIPNEVVVRLVDRGVDPSVDGFVFSWVTEL